MNQRSRTKINGRIFYIVPDIFRKKISFFELLRRIKRFTLIGYLKECFFENKKAVGGIKVFYQHCHLLRELGYDAIPLALGGFDGNLFFDKIKTQHISEVGFRLNKEDVVISTEFSPYDGLKFSNCRRILFAQSWIYLHSRLKDFDKDKSYRELGYDYVISCGEYISKTIRMMNNEECHTINNAIDESIFYPEATIRLENRIMCLPRKNSADLTKIKNMVYKKYPNSLFVDVEGVGEKEIAIEYRKSDIFLSSGYPEGLPLPPLEAMFSGCAIVGFAGRGGRQYLLDRKTALVSEDGDCVGVATDLIELISNVDLKEFIRENAFKEIEQYTIDRMKQSLENFFSPLFIATPDIEMNTNKVTNVSDLGSLE